MTDINPRLKPIAEAPDDRPVILYSAEVSPMWCEPLGASVELGWKGNGTTPGFHTARYGFFPNNPEDDERGRNFTWTHYAEVDVYFLTGYEQPTHRLKYEANGYLDFVVYGVGEEDCKERFAEAARARCKKHGSNSAWVDAAIEEIDHRPTGYIEKLRVGAWVEGEPA